LQREGFPVRIYEQARSFDRIGAGIHVSANVMKVLRRFGAEQRLSQIGIHPDIFTSRKWDTGEVLFELPLDGTGERKYGASYITVHRHDLHEAILLLVELVDDLGWRGARRADAGPEAKLIERVRRSGHKERIAVRERTHDGLRGYITAGARPVLDDELLAEPLRQPLTDAVALPPGRARLATRPSVIGSPPTPKTIGIVVVAALAA
jgi:hypothetical protein